MVNIVEVNDKTSLHLSTEEWFHLVGFVGQNKCLRLNLFDSLYPDRKRFIPSGH